MNIKSLRSDFPILGSQINGQPLIYLDNAATSQKPLQVVKSMTDFYSHHNANVGRSTHSLGEQATQMYEAARATVARFINASPSEIVFTRGTTESINLVAATWAHQNICVGDEILLTELEHHSNLLPWQQLASQKGATLRFIPVNPDGSLDYSNLDQLINSRTKLVAVTHVSNAIGTQVDIEHIARFARAVGAKILIDAAQSAPHQKIDVKKLDVDFLAFSGHKMLAPTGIGILYINKRLHDNFPPYQFGGGMVYEADFNSASFLPLPHRLEAGTPSIAQAIGLAAAIDYLEENIDFDELKKHEALLCARLIDGISSDRITIIGPIAQLKQNGHLVSFIIKDMHPHDVAAYLDARGIAVRAGHHCAQPLAKKLGLDASVRVSFYFYNTIEEVDSLIAALRQLVS